MLLGCLSAQLDFPLGLDVPWILDDAGHLMLSRVAEPPWVLGALRYCSRSSVSPGPKCSTDPRFSGQ